MMSNEQHTGADKKKKRRFRGLVLMPVAALAAVLMALGDRLGCGSGFGLGSGLFGQADTPVLAAVHETADPATQAAETDAPSVQTEDAASFVIEVNEERILYDGKELTIDELRDILLTVNKQDSVWELNDLHARKAEYDQVKALLTECAVVFIEK